MREVYLVSEVFAGFWGGAKGVHGGGYNGRGRLLIIEDRECGGDENSEKYGDGAHPFHAILLDI